MVPLDDERDIEIVRQAAKILDRENQKLTQKVTDLTRELMALKGEDPSKLQLRLAQLEEQLAHARKKLFGESSSAVDLASMRVKRSESPPTP